MTSGESYYLYLVVAAIAVFGVTLGWSDWYSRKR